MNLRDRTVVITGASSGIGRATAEALAREGARVVLAARRRSELEQTARACEDAGARTLIVECDVSDREQCLRLIREAEAWGEVDVLVNNAGFAIFDTIHAASPEHLRSMMDTNYFGAVWCTQAVLPGMIARRRGAIVNVASITGIMGFAGMGGYAASKFAMIGLTESLRNEVLASNITVSAVCPGTTRTDFFQVAEKGKMPAASRLLLAIPPERVARSVLRAIRTGRARIIVPAGAALFMRLKEMMPGLAHMLMRNVSKMIGSPR